MQTHTHTPIHMQTHTQTHTLLNTPIHTHTTWPRHLWVALVWSPWNFSAELFNVPYSLLETIIILLEKTHDVSRQMNAVCKSVQAFPIIHLTLPFSWQIVTHRSSHHQSIMLLTEPTWGYTLITTHVQCVTSI